MMLEKISLNSSDYVLPPASHIYCGIYTTIWQPQGDSILVVGNGCCSDRRNQKIQQFQPKEKQQILRAERQVVGPSEGCGG